MTVFPPPAPHPSISCWANPALCCHSPPPTPHTHLLGASLSALDRSNQCVLKQPSPRAEETSRAVVRTMGLKIILRGASLVAQWLRICLLMKRTRVRALVWEDPTCRGATRPVSHNYWACALQQDRPRQWEARALRWRVAPTCHN